MSEDLSPLSDLLNVWAKNQSPSERRKVARDIGLTLRQKQQRNIARNVEPDGKAMEKRKKRHNRLQNRLKMFRQLRKIRNLKLKVSPDEIEISFQKGFVEKLAEVHHFGLVDKVDQEGRIRTRYPARRLLGFAREYEDDIMDKLASRFS